LFTDTAPLTSSDHAASDDTVAGDPYRDLRAWERRERHSRMLQELAETGMGMARALRQTLALAARIDEERLEQKVRARHSVAVVRQGKDRQRIAVRQVVEEAIGDVAQAGTERSENLLSDLDERLDDPDIDAELGQRSLGEIAARICKDLGLEPDWRLWAEEDWAIEEAQTRPKGSPFAKRLPVAGAPAEVGRMADTPKPQRVAGSDPRPIAGAAGPMSIETLLERLSPG
jgi:hypothetical protein